MCVQGSKDTADSILSHPLEELSQVWLEGRASAGSSGWQDELVIWSSKDMPYLVTYSKVHCPAMPPADDNQMRRNVAGETEHGWIMHTAPTMSLAEDCMTCWWGRHKTLAPAAAIM